MNCTPGGGNLTPQEALEALQALTRLASDRGGSRRRRRLQQQRPLEEGGGVAGGIAFSDSDDCDETNDDGASSVSSMLRSLRWRFWIFSLKWHWVQLSNDMNDQNVGHLTELINRTKLKTVTKIR